MTVYRSGLTPGVLAALGQAPGIQYVSKFGYNLDVDATAAAEDIWGGGGLYTGFPTGAAETVQVFSSDASDAAAGTGLRTIMLSGLDANYAQQTEMITLNGVTPVTSAKTWTRVNRCPGQSAGSGGTNAGIITVRHSSTTANVFAQIAAGAGQTQISGFTVPAGYTACLSGYRVSVSNATNPGTAARVQVSVRARAFGTGLFRMNRTLWAAAGIGVTHVELEGGIVFAEKTDVVLRCEPGASADNLSVTGSYDLFMIRT